MHHQQSDSYSERSACPLYTAIGVVSGRWKPMIIQRLARGPHGFGELQCAMPRVTAKVLREQLRQLENDGLIARRALTPARLGVRYSLTPYAKTLDPVFGALLKWGMQHLEKTSTARGTRLAPPSGPASPPKEARA
ncbi:MAG: helix-turn-helix transcriptional regulator [Cyanobacteria bacterium]|nr:helix-turn-helix transcriptional regulator [Cyanobacteriota bacterium]